MSANRNVGDAPLSKPLILLVEDEALLGAHLEDILMEQGFEVLLVSSGQEAVSVIDVENCRFCGLITDIRHGTGPDGWQLARLFRELVPTLPVIYITGNRADEWSSNGMPGSICISKPFVDAQIIAAIATLLNYVSSDPTDLPASGS